MKDFRGGPTCRRESQYARERHFLVPRVESELVSHNKMDQATAARLFTEGAVLIVLDMPVGTEFGIDYNSWNTGPKFRGVKMVPPGLHFVYFRAVGHGDAARQTGPRTGTFLTLQRRQVRKSSSTRASQSQN